MTMTGGVCTLHWRLLIKKSCFSAFRYAQSRIWLVFCHSLGFLVHWFSSVAAESDLADCLWYVWRRRWLGGGGDLFVCLQKLCLTNICLNVLFANCNFDQNETTEYSYLVLISVINSFKKIKLVLGFQKARKKNPWFLRNDCAVSMHTV